MYVPPSVAVTKHSPHVCPSSCLWEPRQNTHLPYARAARAFHAHNKGLMQNKTLNMPQPSLPKHRIYPTYYVHKHPPAGGRPKHGVKWGNPIFEVLAQSGDTLGGVCVCVCVWHCVPFINPTPTKSECTIRKWFLLLSSFFSPFFSFFLPFHFSTFLPNLLSL